MASKACDNTTWATDPIQDGLNGAKPWIGMYIAAASAACVFAMTLDVFNGFKTKKHWFPCKYFSLNATSLTLLSVAMKITMDLSSAKFAARLSSYSSFVLMSTAMANFITSLGSMADNDAILNLIALGILAITMVTNQWIFYVQVKRFSDTILHFDDIVSVVLLLLLIFLCTLVIIAPTIKRYVEMKFSEMHKMVLNERVHRAKFTAQELQVILKKYWIMAVTGNPQFVLARSLICVIPNVVCMSMTLILLISIGLSVYRKDVNFFNHTASTYKWSFSWILIIQTVGAVIGTIAPTSRLLFAARFRSSRANRTSFKVQMETETYWTQRLIDWKQSPMPLHIRYFMCKKILHISKRVLLNKGISIQIMIVVTSKLILIISSWLINVTFKLIHNVYKLIWYVFKFTSDRGHEPIATDKNPLDFSPYVMLLEGELELPIRILANISNEADKLLQFGKMRKPKNILELLQKSVSFNGVRDFDRKNITSLHVQESRNCWSLTVVTLTSIAIVVPNISSGIVDKLLSSVSAGVPFVKFVEKTFDTSGELVRIRKTAYIIWEQLELEQEWQQKDVVQGNNMNDQTYKEKLFELSTKAKKTVMDFKRSTTDSVMSNPLNWPTNVIAANSMYRVCESLLLIAIDGSEDQLDQNFFERITIIIADILAACLTNLGHLLFSECHTKSIEKRQESIQQALVLLGESEEVIQYLEQREWPNLDPNRACYIDEWQAIIELDNENPV